MSHNIQRNATQHKRHSECHILENILFVVMLSIVILRVSYFHCRKAENHYADCRYAESRSAVSDLMLGAPMLNLMLRVIITPVNYLQLFSPREIRLSYAQDGSTYDRYRLVRFFINPMDT